MAPPVAMWQLQMCPANTESRSTAPRVQLRIIFSNSFNLQPAPAQSWLEAPQIAALRGPGSPGASSSERSLQQPQLLLTSSWWPPPKPPSARRCQEHLHSPSHPRQPRTREAFPVHVKNCLNTSLSKNKLGNGLGHHASAAAPRRTGHDALIDGILIACRAAVRAPELRGLGCRRKRAGPSFEKRQNGAFFRKAVPKNWFSARNVWIACGLALPNTGSRQQTNNFLN